MHTTTTTTATDSIGQVYAEAQEALRKLKVRADAGDQAANEAIRRVASGLAETETEVVTFEVGSAYTCRSACDSDVAWTFEVVRRTAQFITLTTWGDPLGEGAAGLGDVWRMHQAPSRHPAPFPVDLPARAIETTSPKLVLDPYAGSGTTLLAARSAGVRSIGIEMSPRYCQMAAERLGALGEFGDGQLDLGGEP
jgi:hypothetical protein